MVMILTLRLEVSVDETHQMQVLQRSCHLGSIETRIILRDALAGSSLQSSEELSTTAILHAEVKVVFGLERMVESNDEGMVACSKDLLFSQRSLDLVALDHLLFAQDYK